MKSPQGTSSVAANPPQMSRKFLPSSCCWGKQLRPGGAALGRRWFTTPKKPTSVPSSQRRPSKDQDAARIGHKASHVSSQRPKPPTLHLCRIKWSQAVTHGAQRKVLIQPLTCTKGLQSPTPTHKGWMKRHFPRQAEEGDAHLTFSSVSEKFSILLRGKKESHKPPPKACPALSRYTFSPEKPAF